MCCKLLSSLSYIEGANWLLHALKTADSLLGMVVTWDGIRGELLYIHCSKTKFDTVQSYEYYTLYAGMGTCALFF